MYQSDPISKGLIDYKYDRTEIRNFTTAYNSVHFILKIFFPSSDFLTVSWKPNDPMEGEEEKREQIRVIRLTSSADTEISFAFSSASWRMNLTICWICLETSASFIFGSDGGDREQWNQGIFYGFVDRQ